MLNLKQEYDRLKTFDNLAIDLDTADQLAKSGFFYTNIKDRVKCYFCSLEMNATCYPMNVHFEHNHRSPNCVHANAKDVCGRFKDLPSQPKSKALPWAFNTLKFLAGALFVLGIHYNYFYEKL